MYMFNKGHKERKQNMINTILFSTFKSSIDGVSDSQKLTNIMESLEKSEMWISTKSMAKEGCFNLAVTVGEGSSKNFNNQLVACNSIIDLNSKKALDPYNEKDIDTVNRYIEESGFIEDDFIDAFFVEKKVVFVYSLRNYESTYVSTVGNVFANSRDTSLAPMTGDRFCYKDVNFAKAFAEF